MTTPAGPDLLALVEDSYRQHFETPPTRASVSFLGVEQIEVLRYENGGASESGTISYLTLGMSRYPMVQAADSVVDAATAPRAELLLTTATRQDDVWRKLAVLAAAPAVESAVYQIGSRIELGEAWRAGSRCDGALLAASGVLPIRVPGIAEVQVLRVIPACAVELAWARVHGSDALVQRWRSAGTDLADLMRAPVALQ